MNPKQKSQIDDAAFELRLASNAEPTRITLSKNEEFLGQDSMERPPSPVKKVQKKESNDSFLDDRPKKPFKSDTQQLADFLRNTGPPEQPQPKKKKRATGFFNWNRKKEKKVEKVDKKPVAPSFARQESLNAKEKWGQQEYGFSQQEWGQQEWGKSDMDAPPQQQPPQQEFAPPPQQQQYVQPPQQQQFAPPPQQQQYVQPPPQQQYDAPPQQFYQQQKQAVKLQAPPQRKPVQKEPQLMSPQDEDFAKLAQDLNDGQDTESWSSDPFDYMTEELMRNTEFNASFTALDVDIDYDALNKPRESETRVQFASMVEQVSFEEYYTDSEPSPVAPNELPKIPSTSFDVESMMHPMEPTEPQMKRMTQELKDESSVEPQTAKPKPSIKSRGSSLHYVPQPSEYLNIQTGETLVPVKTISQDDPRILARKSVLDQSPPPDVIDLPTSEYPTLDAPPPIEKDPESRFQATPMFEQNLQQKSSFELESPEDFGRMDQFVPQPLPKSSLEQLAPEMPVSSFRNVESQRFTPEPQRFTPEPQRFTPDLPARNSPEPTKMPRYSPEPAKINLKAPEPKLQQRFSPEPSKINQKPTEQKSLDAKPLPPMAAPPTVAKDEPERPQDKPLNGKTSNDILRSNSEPKKPLDRDEPLARNNSEPFKMDVLEPQKKKKRHVMTQTSSKSQTDPHILTRLQEMEQKMRQLLNENDQLRHDLEQSKMELQESEHQRQEIVQTMEDQKRKFDKLSASAYKKIKELLTDRQIMDIEVKSLKHQVRILIQGG
ncbi:hypothetical protein EDD86DRAFT_134253 [Gorgonomyces haynaldii]|nr:hypothetical protein EDD86DRAFT_134253 [Gorgonomyces haynaldii]